MFSSCEKMYKLMEEKTTKPSGKDYVGSDNLYDVQRTMLLASEIIDVKAADFAERIKDTEGTVAVYCRSGKQSLMCEKTIIYF